MAVEWNEVFDNFGVKRVTKTDKAKGAYVPNKQQCAAIEATGIQPASVRPAPEFEVSVLFDGNTNLVKSSYYYSERSDIAGRSPEPRMGHGIISSWLQEGDLVLIGNLGSQVFAIKLESAPGSEEVVAQEVAKRANKKTIFERAKRAVGKPPSRLVQRSDFIRDPYVIAAVLLRSNGKCEMPGCTCDLFIKNDDSPYLEVHHVVPLSEEGDDTLINAAALCPRCHREQHFGKSRLTLRETLRKHITALPIPS